MESEDNEYKVLNFTYSKDDKENEENSEYKIKKHRYERRYLISKSDYEKGNKCLNRINNNRYNKYNDNKFYYYYKFKNLSDKNEKEFVLVDEEYLEKLKCDKKFYSEKFVNFFKSGKKNFIHFEDDEIIEISNTKNTNSFSFLSDKFLNL